MGEPSEYGPKTSYSGGKSRYFALGKWIPMGRTLSSIRATSVGWFF